jgi:hypothetical protein
MKRLLVPVVAIAALLFAASTAATSARPARASVPARASRPTRPAPGGLTKYSIVHGCYTLRLASGSDLGPYRMQATALAQYLLYDVHQQFLGAGLQTATTPSNDTVWNVSGSGKSFTLTNLGTGEAVPVAFVPASGCAVYPEADLDATGNGFKGASPEAGVLGTVEGHAHVTAFEFLGGDFHCGRPWDPYGAPYALPASCAADEQGTNGEFESFLDYGGASRPSNMHGWPTFVDWPAPTTLAEEGDYYTGIERAWKAGLRVLVTQLVDNQALCSLMTTKHNPCDDMQDVQIQSRDLYALQNYIDAQSGGPGKGWFRIVTNPFQARQVLNEGKLAVVDGIEMSELFGCGEQDNAPQCTEAQIDAGLKTVEGLGVRTFFPIHEFDNAFGGTKMIAGELGTIVNAGNRLETGSFWNLQSCPAEDQDAEQASVAPGSTLASLINGPLAKALGGSAVPVYGSGPQCNTRGITDLGTYLIKQMIKQHIIIQLDHMDSKTATSALAIAQAAHYSGVVSAHCCSSPQLFKGIYSTGGFISEPAATATAFAATEKQDRADSNPKYHFGFGWGSDMNGLAEQPGPQPGTPISYPFKSYVGNVTFTREQWGERTFDLNTDGVANYGMYADWLRDLQAVGGAPVMNDMFQGAESYLEMWERADGVPDNGCRPASGRFSSGGVGAVRLGASFQSLLFAAGQPASRPGSSYRYCLARAARGSGLAAVFGSASRSGSGSSSGSGSGSGGRVAMVLTTARRYGAGGVHPGARAAAVRKGGRSLGGGLWLGRRLRGGARYVYGVRGARVRWVAVASRAAVRRARTLRADVRAAGVRV